MAGKDETIHLDSVESIPEMLELFARAGSLEEILQLTRPAGEREAVKRCAVVRTFDRDLYEAVLRSPNLPSFDELTSTPDVEPVPGADKTYRVAGHARTHNWNAWWAEEEEHRTLPDDLRALATRLADRYRTHGRSLDLLTQLVLIDQPGAITLFDELFAEADREFHLARCQDLLDVLGDKDRSPLFGAELIALRHERAAHLRARSLWSTEYLQTGTFLETEGTREVYDLMLGNRGPRVLEMHAPGGRGKTMELRWLISRVLVPRHIPCTKSDFDVVDPVNATKYPWLVLLEAAAQLSKQLPAKPFNSFLEKFGWATPLLYRQVADAGRVSAASKRLKDQHVRLAATVPQRFVRTLNDVIGDRSVVMVFDTLEEIHLRPQNDLAALRGLLRYLHDKCRTVRFVLSGRYSIRADDLPSPMAERELGCFSAVDADRYLAELRGIEKPSLREPIIEKAEGDPFKLSLFADIVQQRPSLTPSHVRKYEADLIYLVLRVIRRIDDTRVRWLLRYGVVPRTLSLEFVREVMQRHLRQVMSGDVELDRPADDVLPDELAGGDTTFPVDVLRSPQQQLDFDELWAQLRKYAGTTSWVTLVPGEPDSVRFHPNVTVPMRRVIRQRRIYHSLHRDAVRYFEHKAKDDPNRWDRWMCEAVFHRFQLEGAAAADYWRAALDAVELGEPHRRAALAAEVLGLDYVDRDGSPREWQDDSPVIAPETVVWAHYELASASTQMARVSGAEAADQLWSHAEVHLDAVERRHEELGKQVVPEWRLTYVRAALAFKAGDVDAAEKHLRGALPAATDLQDGVRLRILLADVQLSRGDSTAPDTYRAALRVARQLPSRTWDPLIRLRIVKAYQELGRLREAMLELDTAMRASTLTAEQASTLRLLAVELGIGAGRLDSAAYHAREVATSTGDWRASAAGARVAMESRRPLRAVELAAMAEKADTSTSTSVETAMGRELTGLAAGAVGRYAKALQALETARSLWHREGDLAAVARCHAHSALLQMREVGNLTVAEHHLNEAAKLELVLGGTAWCRTTLARVELLSGKAEPLAAMEVLTAAIADLKATWNPPKLLVRAAVEGLTIGLPAEAGELLDLLVEQLHLVTPASARVRLLRDMDRVQDLHDDDARAKLRGIAPLLRLSRDRLSVSDRALLQLTVAEVDRLTRNGKAALARLIDAYQGCQDLGTKFFVREWSRALDRLDGVGAAARPELSEIDAFVREFADFPMLCAAFLVERAEALVGVDDYRLARRLLERADPLLESGAEHETQWHARFQEAMATVNRRLSSKWSPALAVAGAAFSVLGNALRATISAGESPGRRSELLEGARGSFRLAVTPKGELDVRTWIPPDTEVHRKYSPDDPFARLLLGEPSAHGGPEPFAEGLAERIQRDWREVGDELGALVLPGHAATALRTHDSSRFDLRCDVRDRRLNTVPWELVRGPDHRLVALDSAISTLYRATSRTAAHRDEIRYAQLGLNRVVNAGLALDGDLGPHTIDELRRYQNERRMEPDGLLSLDLLSHLQRDMATAAPPLVVVARPGSPPDIHDAPPRPGVDLLRLYRRYGFDVVVVENPTLDRLSDAVSSAVRNGRSPAVLHFAGGLRESSGGVALTFLAGGWEAESFSSARTADEIPVTSVDRLLAAVPRDEPRPLVVLDVERPWGAVDLIFYLLLRNAFAGDLFALGRCAGVLGTGLVGDDGYELYESMISSLAIGRSVGEVTTRLRSLTRDSQRLERALPFAGVALHTHLPWLRLVPRQDHGDDLR